MSYMEYKEVQVPQGIQTRLDELRQTAAPDSPATLGEAGFFKWLTELSRDEGWRVVWQGFSFPYVVLEREVFKVLDD